MSRVEFPTGTAPDEIEPLRYNVLVYRAETDKFDPPTGHEPVGAEDLFKTTDPDSIASLNGEVIEVVEATEYDGGLDGALVAELAGVLNVGEIKKDRGLAEHTYHAIKRAGEGPFRATPDGEVYVYENGLWHGSPRGKNALRSLGHRALGAQFAENVLQELVGRVRSEDPIQRERLGVGPGKIPLENGLYDIEEDAIRDLRPEDHAIRRLPVEYDPGAGFDTWAEYVEEWAEDDMAEALQEYAGYTLYIGAMPVHRALLLVGAGANGKSTFLEVVRRLLGEDNTTSIELQTLATEGDAVADLEGSVANIDDDLSSRQLSGSGLGMFKKLMAGNPVRARPLYQSGYKYVATAKHLYAANQVPDAKVSDEDEAFWRRWLLIEFPNHYPPGERDSELASQFTTPEALSGVLNWAIEGLKRLLDQGHFTGEERFAQAKRERWQAWGDSVEKFIAECVENDPDADRLTTGDAHRRFAAWCRENNESPVGQQQFTNTLKDEDVGYRTSLRIDGTPQRGYKALGLSGDVPPVDETPEREPDPAGTVDAKLTDVVDDE